jgi:hypothetical protein
MRIFRGNSFRRYPQAPITDYGDKTCLCGNESNVSSTKHVLLVQDYSSLSRTRGVGDIRLNCPEQK